MNIDVRNREFEIVDDICPHRDVPVVVAATESETSDHLEESQVRAITDSLDVIGSDAILDVAVA